MNYYRRYVGDFQRDTGHLSLTEIGAYDRLLDHYYATEKALPVAPDVLYRITRAVSKADRDAVRSVAEQFFPVTAGVRRNKRADKEIRVSQSARDNGGRGGRPKTEHETGKVTGSATETGTGQRTEHGGGSGHPPASNHQPPAVQPSTATRQPPSSAAADRRAQDDERAAKTRPTRQAYSEAYERRYSVKPIFDKQANSLVLQFVDRVGVEEAPAVAAFYVTHNRQDYVRAKHDVSLLLRDARGLRTEWATGHQVTDTVARQTDRAASNSPDGQKAVRDQAAEELFGNDRHAA